MPEIISENVEPDEGILLLATDEDEDDIGVAEDEPADEDDIVGEEIEDEGEDESPKPQRRRPAPRPRPAKRQAASANKALGATTRESDQSIADWLNGFGGVPLRVVLKRESPAVWDGVPCRGVVMTYDGMVSEDEIMMQHGGGKYQLIVRKRRESGTYVYSGATTFEISGEPKIAGAGRSKDRSAEPTAPTETSQVLNVMHKLTVDAHERANSAEKNSGTDMAMFQTLMAPLQAQLAAVQAQLAQKDSQIVEMLGKPVDTSPQDRLFSIMEGKESSHTGALQTIRMNHDSELRSLRDFQKEELSRRESRFERELDFVREASKREVDTMKTAHTSAFDAQRLGYESRIDGLKDSTRRLERDLDATKKELAELRGKKEIGPIDQIQNLVMLKQGMEALVPSGNDEPVRSGLERAAEVIMQSPLAAGIASRIAGSGPGEQEMQQQLPPHPEDDEDDPLVSIRRPDGQVVQVPQSMVEKIKAAKAAKEAQDGAAESEGPPMPDMDPEDVARAVTFIEGAIKNGTDPVIFAQTARNMMPDAILVYLRHRGVDEFLNNVAQLQTGSPLSTVAGRAWARKVAKFLIEGTTEGVEPPPTSPVESQ